VLAALALAVAAAAAPVRADGDPASDFLIEQQLFVPIYGKISPAAHRRLTETLRDAAARGFPIRVALISSRNDLGSVTELWRKPRPYARFLALEIRYFYKGRLLVVMPNGFGFTYPKHSVASEQSLLARIPITGTPTGLAEAATRAVTELAAARGVRLDEPGRSDGALRDVLLAVGLALLVLAAAAAVRFRRRGPRAAV
jgi:hypothetical protein